MMLSCTLWSCSKSDGPIDDPDDPDNPDAPTNVTLDISVSDLVFDVLYAICQNLFVFLQSQIS